MADAKIQSAFDCFPAQNRQRAWKALRPQQGWKYQPRAPFVRFRTKRGRSPEEHADSMATTHRETRGRSLCPRRCGVRCLREQFLIRHSNQKLLRREFRL